MAKRKTPQTGRLVSDSEKYNMWVDTHRGDFMIAYHLVFASPINKTIIIWKDDILYTLTKKSYSKWLGRMARPIDYHGSMLENVLFFDEQVAMLITTCKSFILQDHG